MTCRCGATLCYICRKPNVGTKTRGLLPKSSRVSCLDDRLHIIISARIPEIRKKMAQNVGLLSCFLSELEFGFAGKKCTACSLWTNSHQDEEMAIAEIKAQAEKERNQLAKGKCNY